MHHNLRISVSVFVSIGNCNTIFVFVSRDISVFELSEKNPLRTLSVFVFDRSGRKLSAPFSPLVSRAEILLYVFLQSIVLSCLYLQFCQMLVLFLFHTFFSIPCFEEYLIYRFGGVWRLDWTELKSPNGILPYCCHAYIGSFVFLLSIRPVLILLLLWFYLYFFSIFVILQRFLTEVFVCPHSVKRT